MLRIYILLFMVSIPTAFAQNEKNAANVVILPVPEKKIIIDNKVYDINSIEKVQIVKTNDSIEIIFE